MDHDDGARRQGGAGVQFGDGGIVPPGDLSEEDIREHGPGELQFGIHAWNVVDGHHTAEHRRKVHDLARRGEQLVVRHGTICGAEEDRLGRDLTNAAARTDRLIVDLYGRMRLVVLVEPLRVDRIRERRARSVDLHVLRRDAGDEHRGANGGDDDSLYNLHRSNLRLEA